MKGKMALFLLRLFPQSQKARQEWSVGKVSAFLLKEVLEMPWKRYLQTRNSHRPGLCGPHRVLEIRILLKSWRVSQR